jgi:outer membrane protein insertion porin family
MHTAARASDAVRLREVYRRQTAGDDRDDRGGRQGDSRDVVFVISKRGHQVSSISFVAAVRSPLGQLRDVISTSQSGWLDVFKSAAFYDPERIERDKELLRRHYHKNGFPDALVTAARAIKNSDGTGYDITFAVVEGERYVFGAATVDARLQGVDASRPGGGLIKPGGACNQDRRQGGRSSPRAHRQGQAFARQGDARRAARRTMDVAFQIEDGPASSSGASASSAAKRPDFVIGANSASAKEPPSTPS